MAENLAEQARRRILVALDVATLPEALALADQLQGLVGGFKIGLELCSAVGVPAAVTALGATGCDLFLDLKLKDLPPIVSGAVRAIAAMPGVRMLTLHCDGGSPMLRAAATAVQESQRQTGMPLGLIGITVLPSIDAARLGQELGVSDAREAQVVRLARLARASGLAGVVATPHEVAAIKRVCGSDFLAITPNIRPAWAAVGDPQRMLPPLEALRAGADYLVVGRPVTAAPAIAGGPAGAAARIVSEICESPTS